MSAVMARRASPRAGVAIADAAVRELSEALGLPGVDLARPGAPGLMAPGVLLRAADGWVHPGPPTAWPDFAAMISVLASPDDLHGRRGTPEPGEGGLPDVSMLSAEAIDREAGEWQLPVAAVRPGPTSAPVVPWPSRPVRELDATVVVLGATWAAPLAGRVLHELGAHVVRVTDPRRPDPFPLRDALRAGQSVTSLDLGIASERDRFAALLERADLLIDATTPRVLRNVGLADAQVPIVRIAAFADDDRPGYGLAAEARGGWAARHDPPRLGRSSVADPVAGLLAVMLAVGVLVDGNRTARARVSLEEAVGHLLALERRDA
ncbi:MAG TPA: CoA transferase [Acidimicrobiia bacterium]|nr:CoA transferase [Acidimicrobiia bacterium]